MIPRRLRDAVAAAVAETARVESELAARRGTPPRPGDVLLVPQTAELGVLWVVTQHDPEAGTCQAVAADPDLLAGGADVVVPPSPAGAGLTVRCAFQVELAAADFAQAELTGCLEPWVLDRVRRKREAITAGETVGTVLEQEAEIGPDYRDVEEVLGKARAALARPTATNVLAFSRPEVPRVEVPRPESPRPSRARRLVPALGLAASILLAVSLGFWVGSAWKKPTHLNVPFAVLRSLDVRGETTVLSVASDTSLLHLILAVDDPRPFPEYRLEIRPEDAPTPLWTSDGLRLMGISEVSVQLPRELLPAGEYDLLLLGLRDAEAVPVGRYALEIEDPPADRER